MLGNVPSLFVIGLLGLLFLLRLTLFTELSARHHLMGGAGIVLFCAAAYVDPGIQVLKMYPVLINSAIACYGIYTLIRPPSAIERLSRAMGMTIEGPALPYTRKLTMVWVGFFIINVGIASYTALATPTSVWAFYNGLLSYVLIGLLIALEYPVRLRYQKRHSVAG